MKRQPWYSTVGRLICYLLVGGAYVLLLMSLSGCEFATAVTRFFGASPSSGTLDAARGVDSALGGWIWSWFHGDAAKVTAGAVITESARLAHRTHKKRKAKKAEHKEAKRRADEIIDVARGQP